MQSNLTCICTHTQNQNYIFFSSGKYQNFCNWWAEKKSEFGWVKIFQLSLNVFLQLWALGSRLCHGSKNFYFSLSPRPASSFSSTTFRFVRDEMKEKKRRKRFYSFSSGPKKKETVPKWECEGAQSRDLLTFCCHFRNTQSENTPRVPAELRPAWTSSQSGSLNDAAWLRHITV